MTLKLGMIGGGIEAFIGAMHREATRLDGHYELVCGAFSSTPERSRRSGIELGISAERTYSDYRQMIERESALPEGERMQVVSIVTPNHVHFEPAMLALETGFHVAIDKPLTYSFPEAIELEQIVAKSGRRFLLTHTYTGYPMVKEARQIVREGRLGKVRKVYVEYPQGWLSTALEIAHQKQAEWRTDPARSGKAGAMGDIGTHAFNMAEYVTGLRVESLCANITAYVPGRRLDDDGDVLLRFAGGASGVLTATQVATGAENDIKIRVFGEKGGLEWHQDDANSLLLRWPDRPAEILRSGAPYLSSFAKHNTRTPSGHPEGYIEAFANLYRNFALCVIADHDGRQAAPEWEDYPGVVEGVRGMVFIEAVISSGASIEKWIHL